MQFKPVPDPPETLETVETAQRAIPLVPAAEAECLVRLRRELGLASGSDARTWLTMLRALGLVSRTGERYARTREDPTRDRLQSAFCDRVYLAAAVVAALDDDPKTASAVFDSAVAPRVPTWERHRSGGAWREKWRARTARLLGWLSLLGVATRDDDGYVRA